MLQTHVVYLLPQAWNQPFLQEARFLLIGKGISRPQSGYSVCSFLTGLVLVSSFSADSIHLCNMSQIKYSISSNHFRFRFKTIEVLLNFYIAFVSPLFQTKSPSS